jgi:hypothetical protein
MKKHLVLTLLFVGLLFGLAGQAIALPVTVNYTGDNIINSLFLVEGGTSTPLTLGVNKDNWRLADSLHLELAEGTSFSLIWQVTNSGAFNDGNPAGFLGEVLFASMAYNFLSGPTWEVSKNGIDGWLAATSYGENDGSNIWNNVNRGYVAGIDKYASWIWSDTNFSGGQDRSLYIKTVFDTLPVPEPSTLVLLGSGLVGLTWYGRKRKLA